MRHKCLAQNGVCGLPHIIKRGHNLDPASLAAPASMNLRLDDPDRSAKRLSCRNGLIDSESRFAARHRHTKARKQCLGLMFMDIHALPPSRRPLYAGYYTKPYSSESTTSFSARTAATEWSNIFCSSSFSAISTTRSTPPAPITTGTPTYNPSRP